MITPTEVVNIVIGCAITVGCIYCVWNGRKVMRKWMEDDKYLNVRINRTTEKSWKDDDDNPANWYLKNPNKFKLIK